MALPMNCNECGYFNDEQSCTHLDADPDFVIANSNTLDKNCPMKEDVLVAVRYDVIYRGEHLYIVVAMKDGIPLEVFVTHATEADPKLSYMLSGFDAMTRMISLSLRTYPLSKIVDQLLKASRRRDDIAGILADLLNRPLRRQE